jgi:hypothetical protein
MPQISQINKIKKHVNPLIYGKKQNLPERQAGLFINQIL